MASQASPIQFFLQSLLLIAWTQLGWCDNNEVEIYINQRIELSLNFTQSYRIRFIQKRWHQYQCDQTARSCNQNLAIYNNNDNLPSSIKITKVGLKLVQVQNKPSKW